MTVLYDPNHPAVPTAKCHTVSPFKFRALCHFRNKQVSLAVWVSGTGWLVRKYSRGPSPACPCIAPDIIVQSSSSNQPPGPVAWSTESLQTCEYLQFAHNFVLACVASKAAAGTCVIVSASRLKLMRLPCLKPHHVVITSYSHVHCFEILW